MLVVISGFSGAGKGTLMKKLMTDYDCYSLSVSATTRSPRDGEQDGVHYFFVSREEFETMIRKGELIEYAEYAGNYYGTPRRYVEEQMKQGRDVILEIEIQGARKVRAGYPDAVLIFITPPGAGELISRLRKRGTETEEVIRTRLNIALTESAGAEDYDYILINDDLDEAAGQLHQLIQNQHLRAGQNTGFIEAFRQDLKMLLK